MLQRLFHVNICVRDMDRSVGFYEDVGFTKVNDFILDDPNLGPGLGVEMKKLRGVFMRVGDENAREIAGVELVAAAFFAKRTQSW